MLAYWRARLAPAPGGTAIGGTSGAGGRERTNIGAVAPTMANLSLSEAALLMQGLFLVDLQQLETGEAQPISEALRSGAMRYIGRDPDERWLTIRDLWRRGGGDCEDLATATAAEVAWREGLTVAAAMPQWPARPVIYRVRPGLAHAVTQLSTGELIDPSKTGGMGGAG